MALILYYHMMEVKDKAISELIELKIGVDKHTPTDCRQRIEFTRKEDFPSKHRPWNYEGIGQEISEHVDRDTFLHLTEIDAACESLLIKAGRIYGNRLIMCADCRYQHKVRTLNALKSDRNLVKEAAVAAISRKARADERKAQELESKAQASRRLQHERKVQELESKAQESRRLEHERKVQQELESRRKAKEAERSSRFVPYSERLAQNHPPLRAWTHNASDAVLGQGSWFTEML